MTRSHEIKAIAQLSLVEKTPTSKSSAYVATVSIPKSQGKHKDVKERSRVGGADKRKGVLVPLRGKN